jgi:hypothetical protein
LTAFWASLFNVAGLVLTLLGAAVAAKGVLLSKDDAISKAGQIGASYYGMTVPTREQYLQQPAVKNLIAQSRWASRGLVLVVVGTFLQIIAALPALLTR